MRLLTSDRRITKNAVIDWVDCSNGQVVTPPEVLPAQSQSSHGRVGMP